MGIQFFGQLGLGNTLNRGDDANEMGNNLPTVALGTGKTAKAIHASDSHTCALLSDDTLRCWGHNEYGQLGLGDVNHRGKEANEMGDSLPVVSLNALATSVRAGLQHSCAILVGGDIKCWGRSFFGQLGLGDNISRGNDPNEMGANLTTTNLGTGLTTKFLAVGYYHTCAGLNDSTVKCCGYNGSGRLGLGDSTSRGTASSHMGDNLPRVALRTGRTAKALTSHGDHTCVLLDNNSVKCWGSNGFGQLGVGSTGDRGDAANEMGDNLPVVELVGP